MIYGDEGMGPMEIMQAYNRIEAVLNKHFNK